MFTPHRGSLEKSIFLLCKVGVVFMRGSTRVRPLLRRIGAIRTVPSCRMRQAIAIVVHDRGMPVSVKVQTVHPRKLAAVRREAAPGAVGSALA
jgi:hypothetical protein